MKWWPRHIQNIARVVLDMALAAGSFVLALYLRWADAMWLYAQDYWREGAALCAFIALGFILYTRLYRRLWRYVSLRDLQTIIKITIATLALFYATMFLFMRLEMLPRSVPAIHGMLLLMLLCAPRFLYRALHERRLQLPAVQQVPVLLAGATPEAELFIRESHRSPSFAYRVVGIIADDAALVGQNVHDVQVFGSLSSLPAVLRKLARRGDAPQRLIIADPALPVEAVRELVAQASVHGLALGRMPRLTDLTRSDQAMLEVRPIDVEDLLGRPQATLNWQSMRDVVQGKVVLITGAGGSIGSELVRQIAALAPARLVLLDQSEYLLYMIDREMRECFADVSRATELADIRDAAAIAHVFATWQPQVVFHAAALKHVPLCEQHVQEAILTNITGTRHVVDACAAHGVGVMVQISTDKAVNPTNVMGACKRLGECYAQAHGQQQPRTRFITVRFGNVLGSTGSVVPLFQHQLAQGGPLTVTHPDMTRYFMTIREAVQLVIQAAALGMAQSEQAAPIYVLDMGVPIRIEDLALQMIRLAGLRPGVDIQIVYTGLRPGEKITEELFYDSEPLLATPHPSIHLAQARSADLSVLQAKLDRLHDLARRYDTPALLGALKETLPEYQPSLTQAS